MWDCPCFLQRFSTRSATSGFPPTIVIFFPLSISAGSSGSGEASIGDHTNRSVAERTCVSLMGLHLPGSGARKWALCAESLNRRLLPAHGRARWGGRISPALHGVERQQNAVDGTEGNQRSMPNRMAGQGMKIEMLHNHGDGQLHLQLGYVNADALPGAAAERKISKTRPRGSELRRETVGVESFRILPESGMTMRYVRGNENG